MTEVKVIGTAAITPGTNPAAKKMSMKKKRVIADIIVYAALAVMAFLMIYPLFFLVNISLKSYQEFLIRPIGFVTSWQFKNFAEVWAKMDVIKRTGVTVLLGGVSVAVNVLISVLAAYPLSRAHFRHSNAVYMFLLASMFFPTSLVATIIVLKNVLGVYGSPVALIIVWSIGSLQLNIFMLYNFIKSLPRDLDDAAFIDGCGYFRYIFTMALPLMKGIVATLATLKAIGCWNDFLNPYIYVTDPGWRTLATGLYLFQGQYASNWPMYCAAVFLVAAPMIVLYSFAQKFIIGGMVAGALKG